MIRRALDLVGNALLAATVGGPVRAVIAGAVMLYAVGSWLGWWWVAAIAVVGIAEAAWCASKLPARWRP